MRCSWDRAALLGLAVMVLCSVWVWPGLEVILPPFSAHMAMHMAVVAVAAPLLALGVAGKVWDPAVMAPRVFAAIPASMFEFVAVWLWHAPGPHHAARHHSCAFVLEQLTFLAAGFWLWASAIGGSKKSRRARAVAGVTGLLLTSMHMTLLGALIALTPRVLYAGHSGGHQGSLSPLLDQQLGGAIMLLMGVSAYLAGGLGLMGELLWSRRSQRESV